jgi:type IV pilus assembly protein PilA
MQCMTTRPGGDDDGFTLIELLVVVIIIGILAAIAIPTYLKQRENAWRTQAVADMKNAALAVETYATDNPANSYAGMDGATEASPALQTEGFRPSQWVALSIVATDTSYCIQGVNQNVPGKTFVYRSTAGSVQIGLSGSVACT